MTTEHPEDWAPDVDEADVREALAKIDAKASEHNQEYAAGMRHARLLVEEALLTGD